MLIKRQKIAGEYVEMNNQIIRGWRNSKEGTG